MTLIERADSPTDASTILVLTTDYAPSMPARGQVGIGSVSMEENETLPARLRTAIESADATKSPIKIVLPEGTNVDGSFTTADAQTLAVLVLDAICGAFAALS